MVSFITKNTLVDNWESEVKNHVEIIIGNKKAFVEHKTLKLFNRDNIKNLEKYQAYKIAVKIADMGNRFPFNR